MRIRWHVTLGLGVLNAMRMGLDLVPPPTYTSLPDVVDPDATTLPLRRVLPLLGHTGTQSEPTTKCDYC